MKQALIDSRDLRRVGFEEEMGLKWKAHMEKKGQLRLPVACVLTLTHLTLNAYVFDATRSFGDQSKFPITNAVALVDQKLATAGIVKAIYPLVNAHVVDGTIYWCGIVLVPSGSPAPKAWNFKVFSEGLVELKDAGGNYTHNPNDRYPSFSFHDVMGVYKKTRRDVNFVTSLDSFESSSNVVWHIKSSKGHIRIYESDRSWNVKPDGNETIGTNQVGNCGGTTGSATVNFK